MKVSEILLNFKKRLSWNDLNDKPSKFPPETHHHLPTEITEDATHKFVTETQKSKIDKIIPYDSSRTITDANEFKEVGVVKTSPDTRNLPSICSGTSEKWGLLQFIRESNNGPTGFQTYYPIDGWYKGRMFTRAFAKGNWSEWKMASDFSGSYNDLSNKPTTFPPATHNHSTADFTEDANHKFVTDAEKNKLAKAFTYDTVVVAGDADAYKTPGIVKTTPNTSHLPNQCSGTYDRYGTIQFIPETANNTSGTQIFVPIDGNYKGKMFTRSLCHTGWSEWYLSSFSNTQVSSWDNKSNKSVTHKVILSAASWTGEAAPYNYDIPISDMDDTKNWEVTNSVDPLMTEEELNAFCEARIIAGNQSTGHINLVAYGEKPTIDINILVIVRGD